jgi:hypothetical protein
VVRIVTTKASQVGIDAVMTRQKLDALVAPTLDQGSAFVRLRRKGLDWISSLNDGSCN